VSSTPIHARCEFLGGRRSFGSRFNIIDDEWISVCIERNIDPPNAMVNHIVPGIRMCVYVRPLSGDLKSLPSDYQLLDAIGQLVLEKCGQKISLILAPSAIHPLLYSTRFGIPAVVKWDTVDYMILDDTTLESLNYLSAATKLYICHLLDVNETKESMALMQYVDYVVVIQDGRDNLDFGLDTLPNLRNLVVAFDEDARPLNRVELGDIGKLARLERLQLETVSLLHVDLVALCNMFTQLSHLWYFSFECSQLSLWIDVIRKSKPLRRAMRNIRHIVATVHVSFSDAVNIIAQFIEALSHLESINHITICAHWIADDDSEYEEEDEEETFAAHLASAQAMARELRSARLCIEITQ
jgi:hypothetical protein